MAVVISLLRGVNLAAHNRVKMDELRALYESLGLEDPRTYVQSGNVIFGTKERDMVRLARRIEKAIEQRFGFSTEVILRTTAELRDAVRRNPFAGRAGINPKSLLVTFLGNAPTPEARDNAMKIKADPEEIRIEGRELYMYFPNGLARPKVSWMAVVKALKTTGTGRNWNSVTKLLEMAEGLEA